MLAQKTLNRLLRYEPVMGHLFWRFRDQSDHTSEDHVAKWNNKWAGKRAGWIFKASCGKRYIGVTIHRKKFFAGRVIMAMHGIEIFGLEIDHIDGNGLNNILSNLRVVTRLQNAQNHRKKSTNTSGKNGVGWHTRDKVWQARGHKDGKIFHIGTFLDFADAVAARRQWEASSGFHPNHGQARPL